METTAGAASWLAFAVFAVVMIMLLAPRMWGAMIACRNPGARARFGGWSGVLRSLLLEFGISVLIAPIMMAFHTLFVLSTLAGRRVEWDCQSRAESGIGLQQAWCMHRGQTIAGIVGTIAAVLLWPESLFWLMPVLVGLVLSIPISIAVSSAPFGAWFKRHALLNIPEEMEPPAIVQLFEQARRKIKTLECPARTKLFHELLDDPLWLRSHFAMLDSVGATAAIPPAIVDECKADIRLGRWSEFSNAHKHTLLTDRSALTELHHEFWLLPSRERVATNRTVVSLRADDFEMTEEPAQG